MKKAEKQAIERIAFEKRIKSLMFDLNEKAFENHYMSSDNILELYSEVSNTDNDDLIRACKSILAAEGYCIIKPTDILQENELKQFVKTQYVCTNQFENNCLFN